MDSAFRKSGQAGLILLVVLYALLAAGYFVLRYRGQWSDPDTTNLALSIATTLKVGALQNEDSYGSGFSYPAVSAFVAVIGGLPIPLLQYLVYPLVAASVSLVAFVMYRELAGDALAGTLATLFLFMQPDFLFVVFRGSHEKITWPMTMLAAYLLAKSFGQRHRMARFAACVGLFYLPVYALIASNVVFGSSFVVAAGLSLAAGFAMLRFARFQNWVDRWRWKLAVQFQLARPRPTPERGETDQADSSKVALRLVYVLVAAMVLWFWHVFYLYTPASYVIQQTNSTTEQVVAVSLGREPRFNPYATIKMGWVSQAAYLGLTLPSFLIAGFSFLVWLAMGLDHLRRKRSLFEDPSRFLLWLLYGGFGAQFAVSFVASETGGASSNLQQRFFPVMMLLSMAVAAGPIVRLWRTQTRPLVSRALALALAGMVLWSSWASLLKATNDPALSNYWMHVTVPERVGVRWVEGHARYRDVWLGLEGIRLGARALAEGFGSESGNVSDVWTIGSETRDILISNVDRDLGVRRLAPLPDVRDENRVYDNGSVAHYHRRPHTPYQR